MLKRKKYVFDTASLQFLQHRLGRSEKLIRFAGGFALSVVIAAIYIFAFNRLFGSPKQVLLEQKLEEVKLSYSLLERRIDYSSSLLADMRSTDNNSYRSVLDMPQIASDIKEGGSGGTSKYDDLSGYINTEMLMAFRSKFEDLKTETNIQYNSLTELTEKAADWKEMWAHLPYIRPVNVTMPLGDGVKFREKHPVLGSPRWHFGQDFRCPVGTDVYATGAGKVIFVGSEGDGFGNKVVIDHGYGYISIYGHLSGFRVKQGQQVKRGDLIAISGNTGLSSGPHLHYQIELHGEHVNPLWYFTDDLTEEEYFRMLDDISTP